VDEQPLQQKRRLVFPIMGLTDSLLGGAVLLTYFDFLPIDISEWGIPRWVLGVIGAIWFFSGIGVSVYQITNTEE
jgi:hypothetical protein